MGRRESLGPLFRINLHLLNILYKKEQQIHRRMSVHHQAPGIFPGGELSEPL